MEPSCCCGFSSIFSGGGGMASGGQDAGPRVTEVGYITDLEGNMVPFEDYLRSPETVLYMDEEGRLQFHRDDTAFVYGGDVFDRGNAELRIARLLVDLKKRHPDRVFLILGNRDIIKMRLTSELDEEYIRTSSPRDAFYCFWEDKEGKKLDAWLEEKGVEDCRKSRLKFINECTSGAPDAFEYRRQELSLLAGGADVSDEEVTESFWNMANAESGEATEYLRHAQIGAIIGDTLFVHGAAEEKALGFVPSTSMRYRMHEEGEVSGYPGAREGLPLREWLREVNDFARRCFEEWRAERRYRPDGSRGGEALMAYHSKACTKNRSVVVASYVDGKNIAYRDGIYATLEKHGIRRCADPWSPKVQEYLAAGGVRRVVVGHMPSGEAPATLVLPGFEVISADTNYATKSEPLKRGGSWNEVRLYLGAGGASQARVHGSMADGRGDFDFFLPALGGEDGWSAGDGDPYVGGLTSDGHWVRTRTGSGPEAKYWIAKFMGGWTVDWQHVAAADLDMAPASAGQ